MILKHQIVFYKGGQFHYILCGEQEMAALLQKFKKEARINPF
jgi:hypothetical protein